jgi:hypothetical protein
LPQTNNKQNNMKKIFLLAFAGLALLNSPKAQQCTAYFPMREGAIIEYQQFNAKDKLESTTVQKVLKKEVNGNTVTVKVNSVSTDDKGKQQGSQDFELKCDNGVFSVSMQKFLDPKSMEGFKDMDVKITGDNLETPGTIKAGDVLKDATMTVTISSNGMTMMTMVVKILNRKVEAEESVTTPAGTFSCFKMTYDVETKTMFKVQTKGIDWITKDVGVVKSETYDANGKKQGYQILNKLQN